MPEKIFLIGHRGAAALEPENTIRAFKRGIECGAGAIEFDVRQTKDKKLVVIHDSTLDRTTDGKGRVKDFTLNELKKLDAGRGEEIPGLSEALDFAKKESVHALLEIKEEGTEKQIAFEVKARSMQNQITFISFSPASVRAIKNMLPESSTGLIFSRPLKNPVGLALALRTGILFPRKDILVKELSEKAHRNGIKISAWVLNDPEEIRRSIELGIDGFTSDDPCFAASFLKSLTN